MVKCIKLVEPVRFQYMRNRFSTQKQQHLDSGPKRESMAGRVRMARMNEKARVTKTRAANSGKKLLTVKNMKRQAPSVETKPEVTLKPTSRRASRTRSVRVFCRERAYASAKWIV